jgi:hypothetical protein
MVASVSPSIWDQGSKEKDVIQVDTTDTTTSRLSTLLYDDDKMHKWIQLVQGAKGT